MTPVKFLTTDNPKRNLNIIAAHESLVEMLALAAECAKDLTKLLPDMPGCCRAAEFAERAAGSCASTAAWAGFEGPGAERINQLVAQAQSAQHQARNSRDARRFCEKRSSN